MIQITQYNRIPKLRFPEFKNNWTRYNVGDIGTFLGGGTPPTQNIEYWQGDIPWISSSDLIEDSIYFINYHRYINQKAIDESATKNIPPKSILIVSRVGVGKVAVNEVEVCTSQDFSNLIVKNDYYIFIAYLVKNIANRLSDYNQGTSIKGFVKKDLESIIVFLPSLPEQQKIASFLSVVDKKIQQLTRRKELLEQYKKGVMQKIFSQEIRFKDESGNDYPDWEERELHKIFVYEQPTKYLVKSTDYDNRFITPVLTAGKSFILGYSNEVNGIFKNNLPVIIFDDFTTDFKYVDFPFKVKSSAMKILKAKNEKVDIKFVYESMSKIRFPLGEHKRYWISEYQFMKISYPSYEEQKEIGEFFKEIDNKITLIERNKNKVEEFKKGLLQQMFV